MQYLGGKSRIAKKIAAYLRSVRKPGQLYIEPFVGGASVLVLMENPRQASDLCEDLILLYQALQGGWMPPETVTEEEYCEMKNAPPSALRGFVGFACSFAGKWFGGYARAKTHYRNYALNAVNGFRKLKPRLEGVQLYHCDYRAFTASNALIYCDPPYAATTGYDATTKFNWVDFWEHARYLSQNNTVIISEYAAPEDFVCVLEIPTKLDMNRGAGKPLVYRTERLFQWAPALKSS